MNQSLVPYSHAETRMAHDRYSHEIGIPYSHNFNPKLAWTKVVGNSQEQSVHTRMDYKIHTRIEHEIHTRMVYEIHTRKELGQVKLA